MKDVVAYDQESCTGFEDKFVNQVVLSGQANLVRDQVPMVNASAFRLDGTGHREAVMP